MIIFTTNINAYDNIPDHFYDGDVKYVMFYDKPIEQKGDWEFIKLDCKYDHPVLNAYHTRCNSHLWFDEPHVWIDGCYTMTEEFVKNSKEFLDANEITLMHHPDKRSLLREIMKLYRCNFVPKDRLIKFSKDLAKTGFDPNFMDHTINCCLWRNNTPKVKEWNERYWYWYEHYKLFHGCQITSAIAEWEVYGKILPRVKPQVDLSKSTRAKSYPHSYDFTSNQNELRFRKEICNIFSLPFDELPYYDKKTIDDKLIVYTCITNAYDEFPKESYYDPDVRYVCFHDGSIDTTVEPWEYIKLDLPIEDPRDFAYFVKAHPHKYFPEDSYTVWIDGCFILTKEFIDNSLKSFPFSVLRHGGSFSYYDEMIEGFTCAFFSYDDAISITKNLSKNNYDFKKYSSPQCTILWRKLTEEMRIFNETWYDWGSKNYNRDNIPFDASIQFTGMKPRFYDDRNDSGINLGFYNKVGRKKKHPQHGDKKQYLIKNKFLVELEDILGLPSLLYATYQDHEFYMKYFDII
tara:strand:+ start:1048 stop:2598 length:1551 start_codon:yes stop_codon:yes gene_type:complete